jgi:hypothetical protein
MGAHGHSQANNFFNLTFYETESVFTLGVGALRSTRYTAPCPALFRAGLRMAEGAE